MSSSSHCSKTTAVCISSRRGRQKVVNRTKYRWKEGQTEERHETFNDEDGGEANAVAATATAIASWHVAQHGATTASGQTPLLKPPNDPKGLPICNQFESSLMQNFIKIKAVFTPYIYHICHSNTCSRVHIMVLVIKYTCEKSVWLIYILQGAFFSS